jgi:host factor-I protein
MARVDPDLKPVPVRSADGPKASERAQGLQETFLNHVRTNAVPLTVFLLNGVKLQGVVTAFDNFSLLLQRGADSQLVYKHAISTIMPTAPIQLYEPEKPSQDEKALEPAPRRPVVEIRRR